jgi:hypothetical protein
MEGREGAVGCSEGRDSQECTTEEGIPQIVAGNAASAGASTVALSSAYGGCSSGCRIRWRQSKELAKLTRVTFKKEQRICLDVHRIEILHSRFL